MYDKHEEYLKLVREADDMDKVMKLAEEYKRSQETEWMNAQFIAITTWLGVIMDDVKDIKQLLQEKNAER